MLLLPTVLETGGLTSSRVAGAGGLFQFAYPVGPSNNLCVLIFFFTSMWRPLMGYREAMVEKPMVGETIHNGEAGREKWSGQVCAPIT